jgi:hypothetical protein
MRTMLRYGSEWIEIMSWFEPRRTDVVLNIRDRSSALQFLRRFLRDPMDMMALRNSLADGFCSARVFGWTDHEVLEQLAWRIACGQTAVVSKFAEVYGGGSRGGETEPAAEAPPAETVRKRTSWIELELIDEAGKPVPGKMYELVLPDGLIRRGSLDSKGQARITDIDAGTCKVLFPELDAEAWEPV